jgi:hypothetical protein
MRIRTGEFVRTVSTGDFSFKEDTHEPDTLCHRTDVQRGKII